MSEQPKTLETVLEDIVRRVVREELAANGNGHQEAKLLYDTKEAARLCNVKPTWLAAAARTGKVKCRRLGYYVRFALEDLKDLIDQAGKEND